ncbi:hypothetical protein KC19_1G324700 [Ceratodon purpureus]|uniref:Uncharacterized protein n=1 Tax=Ceratodon purpureus TaxID=3225 RepID=A0A8T0JD35_CERPU|nr:hypothetical protein KC19_1G324700 [Ceratodon purpureus]
MPQKDWAQICQPTCGDTPDDLSPKAHKLADHLVPDASSSSPSSGTDLVACMSSALARSIRDISAGLRTGYRQCM